jgi:hypothetical protein
MLLLSIRAEAVTKAMSQVQTWGKWKKLQSLLRGATAECRESNSDEGIV